MEAKVRWAECAICVRQFTSESAARQLRPAPFQQECQRRIKLVAEKRLECGELFRAALRRRESLAPTEQHIHHRRDGEASFRGRAEFPTIGLFRKTAKAREEINEGVNVRRPNLPRFSAGDEFIECDARAAMRCERLRHVTKAVFPHQSERVELDADSVARVVGMAEADLHRHVSSAVQLRPEHAAVAPASKGFERYHPRSRQALHGVEQVGGCRFSWRGQRHGFQSAPSS